MKLRLSLTVNAPVSTKRTRERGVNALFATSIRLTIEEQKLVYGIAEAYGMTAQSLMRQAVVSVASAMRSLPPGSAQVDRD